VTRDTMDVLELLRKHAEEPDLDFLREAHHVLTQAVMDAEVSVEIGAGLHERTLEGLTHRNGYRARRWDTKVGTLDLRVPKLRTGSYCPTLLEPRRRSERALLAVIQQAYVEGVSTRRVEDLVQALGCEGISKSQVSHICGELDTLVQAFRGRPLTDGPHPYVWLNALTQKVREAGRIVNVSVVVATAVNGEGRREVLGLDVGASEDGAFWLAFLRGLAACGLRGVQLVTSDAHQGLKDAIAAVFTGASWQRCQTHFMTNLLSRVPRSAQPAGRPWCARSTGGPPPRTSGPSTHGSSSNCGRAFPTPRACCWTLPPTCSPSARFRRRTGARYGLTARRSA